MGRAMLYLLMCVLLTAGGCRSDGRPPPPASTVAFTGGLPGGSAVIMVAGPDGVPRDLQGRAVSDAELAGAFRRDLLAGPVQVRVVLRETGRGRDRDVRESLALWNKVIGVYQATFAGQPGHHYSVILKPSVDE